MLSMQYLLPCKTELEEIPIALLEPDNFISFVHAALKWYISSMLRQSYTFVDLNQ